MTAQIEERIFYKGDWETMSTEPLVDYLKTRPDIKFRLETSACWRGYFGSWKIKDDKLYLTDIEGFLVDVGEVDLNHLFPNQDEVFAEWYTGTITLPRGEMLDYVHMGYYTLFEYDLLIEIKNGRVVKEEMRSNYEEYKRRLKKRERERREAENPILRKRRERRNTGGRIENTLFF